MSESEDIQLKKQQLQENAKVSDNLQGLRTHQGYRELIRLFQNLYNESMLILSQHGRLNSDYDLARSKLIAIEEIMSQIDVSIKLGDVAKDELKSDIFKQEVQATQ